jgi:hypothetical protein
LSFCCVRPELRGFHVRTCPKNSRYCFGANEAAIFSKRGFGKEIRKVHLLLLVRSDQLWTCEKLLEIRTITDRVPDWVNLQTLAGQIEAAKSAGEEALPLLETRLKEQPDDPGVIVGLYWVYLALGRNADALRVARQAADALPIEKDAVAGPLWQNHAQGCTPHKVPAMPNIVVDLLLLESLQSIAKTPFDDVEVNGANDSSHASTNALLWKTMKSLPGRVDVAGRV